MANTSGWWEEFTDAGGVKRKIFVKGSLPRKARRKKLIKRALAATAVVCLLAILMGRPKSEPGPIIQAEAMSKVVVVSSSAEAGKPVDISALTISDVPSRLVPQDAVTSLENLEGKVYMASLTKNSFLTKASIGNPQPIIAVKTEPDKIEDPFEVVLRDLANTTSSVSVEFDSQPERGSRISVLASDGKNVLVLASEAWVEGPDGRKTKIRVPFERMDFFTAFKQRRTGGLQAAPIPEGGKMPDHWKVAMELADLNVLSSDDNQRGNQNSAAQKSTNPKERKLLGYAWVPGENYRLSVYEDGTIEPVGR